MALAGTAALLICTAPARADDKPAAAGQSAGQAGGDACVDETVKADLFAKRRMRGTRDRLFQQTNRHEFTLRGGYYVSDLLDGTYVVGAAYAYHMTEDLALEASGAYTRLNSSAGSELERSFVLLQNKSRRALLFDADLVWAPAHGKLRVGGSIIHFDPYLAAGGGVVDSVLSSDLAGNGGFGLKFFVGKAMAIRLDLRDHIYRQQLLDRKILVNDLSTMLGVSLYLPLGE
ncbi:MAG TPA: outer membrane beta-barrel domain-containing protein [Polyangia bacterium]|jgi:outer membrane beta-barrel protein